MYHSQWLCSKRDRYNLPGRYFGDIGDGDVVTVRVATAAPDSCTVTSTGVTMTVSAAPIANLISNATDDTICAGSAVVITADDVPGATYTFRLNGLAVPAGDVVGRVYTTSAITQQSTVTVEVTMTVLHGLFNNFST
ncbi:MAG: hypothetical protein CM15mP122_4120 [Bacteroidota bacterium]|nr:MAG: hypothetical protein CM15mP122_4120 [Bacteroidota bacterium]